MATLIPYGTPLGPPMLDPRITAAGKVGKFIFTHRREFKDFFKKKRTSKFSQARKKGLLKVGEDVGVNNAKSKLQTATEQARAYRTINTLADLTAIKRRDDIAGGDDVSRRNRDLVNFLGCKVCIVVRNATNTPMYLNVAVVAPKYEDVTAANPIEGNFLRHHTGNRGLDYSNTVSPQFAHCTAINSDRYAVLTHKRVILGNASGVYASNGVRENWKSMQFYVPINRQIRYRSGADNAALQKILLICWASDFNGTGVGTINDYFTTVSTVTYFKETST